MKNTYNLKPPIYVTVEYLRKFKIFFVLKHGEITHYNNLHNMVKLAVNLKKHGEIRPSYKRFRQYYGSNSHISYFEVKLSKLQKIEYRR